jgi:hypothetical protein
VGKFEVHKRQLSINSRLFYDGVEVPGVETVMITQFQNSDEVHLSIIIKSDQIEVTDIPEPEDGLDKFIEDAGGATA